MHLRRSCSAYFDALFLTIQRAPTAPIRSGSNLEEKRSGPSATPDLLCRTYAHFALGRPLSLPLLTGCGYLYPKKFGKSLRAREGKQPVSTQPSTSKIGSKIEISGGAGRPRRGETTRQGGSERFGQSTTFHFDPRNTKTSCLDDSSETLGTQTPI